MLIPLRHGEPIRFGAEGGSKGVVIDSQRGAHIVDVADVGEDALLVHDETRDDPSVAFMLSRLARGPHEPTPDRRVPRRGAPRLRRGRRAPDRGGAGRAGPRRPGHAAALGRHLGGQLSPPGCATTGRSVPAGCPSRCASSPSPSRGRRTTTCWPSPARPRRSASARSSGPTTTWRWRRRLEPGPTDAWVTLAGLARDTERIRLGTLVTAATFRLPGPLAIAVAQVDAMSGGRVELGLGTGWYEQEHAAYGIPFPPLGERFDRLEEQLAVVTGLWETPAGERFSFDGAHYQLADSPALPKPVQSPRPPVSSSAAGASRTPRAGRPLRRRVQRAVPAAGRRGPQVDGRARRLRGRRRPGHDDVVGGAGRVLRRGRGRLRRRAAAIGHDRRRAAHGAAGTVAEVVDGSARFAEAGAERIYLQVLDLHDLDHLRLVAAGCGARERGRRPAGRADPPASARRRSGRRARRSCAG